MSSGIIGLNCGSIDCIDSSKELLSNIIYHHHHQQHIKMTTRTSKRKLDNTSNDNINKRLKQIDTESSNQSDGDSDSSNQSDDDNDTDDNTCTICFERQNDTSLNSCIHSFCQICIKQWLKNSDTCPSCRSTVQRTKSKGKWFNVIDRQYEGEYDGETHAITTTNRCLSSSSISLS